MGCPDFRVEMDIHIQFGASSRSVRVPSVRLCILFPVKAYW